VITSIFVIALGVLALLYHGDWRAGDCGLIFLAVTLAACDHRNRRTEHLSRCTSLSVYYACCRLITLPFALRLFLRRPLRGPRPDADVLYAMRFGVWIRTFVAACSSVFSLRWCCQGSDAADLCCCRRSIMGIHAGCPAVLEGYLLGVDGAAFMRGWVCPVWGIAGFAFSFPAC